MGEPTFWDHPQKARKTVGRIAELKVWLVPYREIERRVESLNEFFTETDAVDDPAFFEELTKELSAVEEEMDALELRKMLSGELDSKNCYLSINSGAGGTEACDWAAMLARMYQRWAVRRGWKVELLDEVDGDVTGYKSITFHFTGPFAYGYSKSEKGVHRLVRISPFDAGGRRHTSFASVDVTPEIDEELEVELRPEHLRIDTFRSSGAGGQHVNTTDSAVRITHIPSGIVVSCQKERSQLQNKETCLKMLRAKLYEQQVEEKQRKLKNISGEKKEIAWGSQIRSYTFQPYTLVKDHRTKCEAGNIQEVMDGGLDPFVDAFLKEFGG